MDGYTFLIPLLLTIGGLVIGALLKSLLKHSRIPYTVGLFAIGILLGVLNRSGIFQGIPALSKGIDSVANINPDLILYLFPAGNQLTQRLCKPFCRQHQIG